MKILRVALAVLPLLGVCACSGGGSGTAVVPGPAWEKFRHDANNSGQGSGSIISSTPVTPRIKWTTTIDPTPTVNPMSASPAPTPRAILASPAIDLNGTVYVATQGGTLASLNPATGAFNWSVSGCPGTANPPSSCPPAAAESLGPLIASPAVYNFNALNYIFVASDSQGAASGSVYMFQDNGTTRTCAGCFQPTVAQVGRAPVAIHFLSSPTFTTNPTTGAVSSVIIGAAIDVTAGGTRRTIGQLYALNTDGSLIWQFPKVGAAEIGGITSSPALGAAEAVFFTTDDGYLYSLASDGAFKWKVQIGTATDARILFSPSPLTNNLIFVPTTNGQILAINPDGSSSWSVSSPDGAAFLSSLVAGVAAATNTPSITATPTPPPGAGTPTASVTPIRPSTAIFGVSADGALVQINAITGDVLPTPAPQTPLATPVVTSPFLSFEGYLVVGTADGRLHAINTVTGEEPPGWPVILADGVAIRSSPSIDDAGVIYVGADNGIFYAVETQAP